LGCTAKIGEVWSVRPGVCHRRFLWDGSNFVSLTDGAPLYNARASGECGWRQHPRRSAVTGCGADSGALRPALAWV